MSMGLFAYCPRPARFSPATAMSVASNILFSIILSIRELTLPRKRCVWMSGLICLICAILLGLEVPMVPFCGMSLIDA